MYQRKNHVAPGQLVIIAKIYWDSTMIGLEKGVVRLVDYQPEWPELFEIEKNKLKNILGNSHILIEHMGSTSIPGIKAKPIIDIMIGINVFNDGYELAKKLENANYRYKGENGIPGRHYFEYGDPSVYHLHMVEINSDFWIDHILFRDHLRINKETRDAYECLKIALAKKYPTDRDAYCDSKSEFISGILQDIKSIYL